MREPSDALVIFGITGDLAYKKIFPALQALVRRGRLTVPVVGVARSGTLENLIERARASLEADGCFVAPSSRDLALRLQGKDPTNNADEDTYLFLLANLCAARKPNEGKLGWLTAKEQMPVKNISTSPACNPSWPSFRSDGQQLLAN